MSSHLEKDMEVLSHAAASGRNLSLCQHQHGEHPLATFSSRTSADGCPRGSSAPELSLETHFKLLRHFVIKGLKQF